MNSIISNLSIFQNIILLTIRKYTDIPQYQQSSLLVSKKRQEINKIFLTEAYFTSIEDIIFKLAREVHSRSLHFSK